MQTAALLPLLFPIPLLLRPVVPVTQLITPSAIISMKAANPLTLTMGAESSSSIATTSSTAPYFSPKAENISICTADLHLKRTYMSHRDPSVFDHADLSVVVSHKHLKNVNYLQVCQPGEEKVYS